MEILELAVGPLSSEAETLDLANALNPLNGVAAVSIDAAGGQVAISFDPAFGSAETIRSSVEHSGYPLRTVPKK